MNDELEKQLERLPEPVPGKETAKAHIQCWIAAMDRGNFNTSTMPAEAASIRMLDPVLADKILACKVVVDDLTAYLRLRGQ